MPYYMFINKNIIYFLFDYMLFTNFIVLLLIK